MPTPPADSPEPLLAFDAPRQPGPPAPPLAVRPVEDFNWVMRN